MEHLVYIVSWGTPLGIGLFLLFLSCSAAILIRAISSANKRDKQ